MDQLGLATWALRLSILSFFVAGCSVIVAIQQLRANRAHQRLSVKPYLTLIRTLVIEKGEASELRHPLRLQNATWNVTLANTGIGPALIEGFDIYIDGERIKSGGEAKWAEAMSLLTQKYLSKSFRYTYFALAKDFCIANGKEITILTVKHLDVNNDRAKAFQAINASRMVINYKSFYGDSQVYDTDDYKEEAAKLA